LRKFPLNSNEGMKYWNNYRKAPKPLKIDYNDESTINFFKSFYYIITYIIKYNKNNYIIDETELKSIILNEESNIKLNFITYNNEELKKEFKNNIINIIDKNNDMKKKIQSLEPISFDKDNDENQHINIIMSMSNLRAKNYQINECDFLTTKEIAGNIIPAIASTTAAITGLSCLQIYNILQTDNIDYYRSTAFNLGTSEYNFFIPEEKRFIEDIQKTKETPEYKTITKYTVWDKINLNGPNMKVNTILDIFKKNYNVDIDNINYYNINLVSLLLDGDIDLQKTIEDLFEEKTGKHIDKRLKYIELNINGSIGDAEILTPKIRYCL
jgi:ubiquitin-activating enzyme E1